MELPSLTINGSGFVSSSTVTFNGVAHALTFVNASQLTIQLSASDLAVAGTLPVVVTNPPPGGGASNSVSFTVDNPTPSITSLSPNSIVVAATTQVVTINGSGFVSSSTVTFNGVAHALTFVNASQLTIQLSASDLAVAGTLPVVVTNPPPGGGASNSVSFTVDNPTPSITSLSPNSIVVAATTQVVTINGSGFVSSSTVTFNGVAHALTFVNASQLTIQLSASDLAAVGTFPVVVTNPPPGGGATPNAIFEITGIFGHAYQGSFPNGAEIVVSINPGIGNIATVGTVPNSGSLDTPQGIAALDTVSHRYFFLEGTTILHELDTTTGAEVGKVALSPQLSPSAMEFDRSSGKLFGHAYQGSFPNGAEILVSIDPSSGNIATVGTVPDSGSLATPQGIAALDTVSHRYFFLEGTTILHELDTTTGAEVGKVALSPQLSPSAMEFDRSSGKLFGHAYQGSFPNGAEILVSIDPSSGNIATVGTVPNSGSLATPQGIAALDAVSHRYFFLELANTTILHTIDTTTGTEIGNVTLSLNPSAIVAN